MKKMMKRAFFDLRQSHAVDDEAARAKLKHQTLLQEYLQLQKEVVSNKKKLQTSKQKRDSLLAEVGFLRQRHRYLLKIKYPELKLDDLVQTWNSDVSRKGREKKRNCLFDETPLGSPYSVLASNPDSRVEENRGEERERERIGGEPLGVGKKSRSGLISDRRVGKKKISWKDYMPLKE